MVHGAAEIGTFTLYWHRLVPLSIHCFDPQLSVPLLNCPVQRTISVVTKRVRQLNEREANLRHPSKTLLRLTINKLRTVERQQTVWTVVEEKCTIEAADHRVFTSATMKSLWTAKQKRGTVETIRLHRLWWRKRICCPVLFGGQTPRF